MRLNWTINACIMLLVAAGLLLAPLAGPTLAGPMPHKLDVAAKDMAGHDMSAMSDQQAMADDMPCCPDQTKSKSCDGCPLIVLCMLGASLPAPAGAVSVIERQSLRNVLALHDDRLVDGLQAKPPDHPPRYDV